MNKKIIYGAILVLLLILTYFGLFAKTAAPHVVFNSINGQQISLRDLRGKVVIVNFWATSCSTCLKEMPDMVKTYQAFHDKGLEFVAVAMSYDVPEYVVNYARSKQLPFIVAIDKTGDVASAFDDVKLTPTTFVIDQQGNIIKHYVGEPDFNALSHLLQTTLGG